MFGYVYIALCTAALLWLSKTLFSLRRNIAIAEASSLPYTISPLNGFMGMFWVAIHDPFLAVVKAIPYCRNRLWHIILEPHRGWNYAQEMRDAFGETFLIVSPGQIYMNTSNAEAIVQITTRRNDFLKPIYIYGIVDIFGRSMLTSEGDDWKRHRRIVAPAFSEKSNALVWTESLRQAAAMLGFWSRLPGNSPGCMKVDNTATDTAMMTLHVISAAGFGVRQVWSGDDESQLGDAAIPGFNTTKLKNNHSLTFKNSLNTLLHGIIWMALIPVWLLKILPFDVHKKVLQSYFECADYFRELSEYKVQQLALGEQAEEGTMDLMGPLVKASENRPDDPKGQYMTKQDVIANSFIFLFAGHETTANTLHFAFLFLAISLDSQARLQKDVDAIVGSQPCDDWTYDVDMGRLYTSRIGATMNETLRLMPPVIDIPKVVKADRPQPLTIDGKARSVPADTFIHINAVGAHRNPRYWPHSASKISDKAHDLDDFVPERWLPGGDQNVLFMPTKGAFLPFSEGARACPGRRFAQVEVTGALAAIFRTHSVELDVTAWASDAAVMAMGREARRAVYEAAKASARRLVDASDMIATLQMQGTHVPVRFVKRGEERFMPCYVS